MAAAPPPLVAHTPSSSQRCGPSLRVTRLQSSPTSHSQPILTISSRPSPPSEPTPNTNGSAPTPFLPHGSKVSKHTPPSSVPPHPRSSSSRKLPTSPPTKPASDAPDSWQLTASLPTDTSRSTKRSCPTRPSSMQTPSHPHPSTKRRLRETSPP